MPFEQALHLRVFVRTKKWPDPSNRRDKVWQVGGFQGRVVMSQRTGWRWRESRARFWLKERRKKGKRASARLLSNSAKKATAGATKRYPLLSSFSSSF
jgi:hypothetical protein